MGDKVSVGVSDDKITGIVVLVTEDSFVAVLVAVDLVMLDDDLIMGDGVTNISG